MPALGRIIYFSNSGREEARERPASTSQAAGAQRRGRGAGSGLRLRVAAGLRAWDVLAGSSDAGGVTQVAAGRGEAEAQRYRKGGCCGVLREPLRDASSLPLVPVS